jgi:environmental stress-induced protein Ves
LPLHGILMQCDNGFSCINGECMLLCNDETTCVWPNPSAPLQFCADTTSDPYHCGECWNEVGR